MEKSTVKVRFNAIKEKFKAGDSARIAEISGKKTTTCRQIIGGIRNPQQWFVDAAEDYLRTLGRI